MEAQPDSTASKKQNLGREPWLAEFRRALPQNEERIDRIPNVIGEWIEIVAISNPLRGFDEPQPTRVLD